MNPILNHIKLRASVAALLSVLLPTFLLGVGFVGFPNVASGDPADPTPDLQTFREKVQPFLKTYCGDCHGADSPEADLTLTTLTGDLAASGQAKSWERALDQLTLSQMPPEDVDQPTAAELRPVMRWIKQELLKSGARFESKLTRPGYGNYVSHAVLFDQKPAGPAFSPPRIWRIRPQVYGATLRQLAKNGKYVAPFNLRSGGHGFRDYDNQYVIAGADLSQLLANTNVAATLLTEVVVADGETKRGRYTPQPLFEILASEQSPSAEQLTNAMNWLYSTILFREPTEEELEKLLLFTESSIEANGMPLGVKNMVSAVLLSPKSLYRSEQGEGPADEFGRVRLSGRETAFAIAYALTDQRPDRELLTAADSGNLATREQVQGQVERILETEKISKPRILGFFREYFEYDGALDVFKDRELFRSHDPRVLVKDTDQLVLHFFHRDKEVLRELLTTRKSFVQFAVDNKGQPLRALGNRAVHLSYSLPLDWKWVPDQPLDLPGDQRAGILTQPSWLVAKSDNFDNHAINRGLWIRNKLLGGTVLDLPITVDAQLPEDPTLTLRERMKVTEAQACWKCHRQSNPLGLPFEQFDHFGRWRTKELEQPVDTSGEIASSGDASLDGKVSDPLELIHKLADSPRVRQVFVRHAFRYWMGRNETPHDAATLQRADQAYVESGGSMKQLIVSLLTSDSFLYRKEL